MRLRLRGALLGLFVTLCLLAQIWPGYTRLAARIEPMVLGLPFSFFWVVAWVVVTFFVVLLYHVTAGER